MRFSANLKSIEIICGCLITWKRVILWPQTMIWHKTLITVPFVGRKWRLRESCPARISSTSKYHYSAFLNKFYTKFYIFSSCLQSWLEQDTSCPTCRLALSVQNSQPQPNRPNTLNLDELDQIAGATVNNATGAGAGIGGVRNNHFFHFNGSRYVSWLPNFSVEVSNLNNVLRNGHLTATINQLQQQQQTSQLRNMAIHVSSLVIY